MEQHLFILLFFTGVIPLVLSVPRKYYLIQQAKTWSDAQAYCRAEHVDLAIILSNDDMVQLQNEAQRQQLSVSAWIGLYDDINSWRWSLGNESLGTRIPWKAEKPDNKDGKQWCGFIDKDVWSDEECTKKLPSVCFDETKNDTDRYIFIPNTKSWYDAQTYCRTQYTDLASDRGATEGLAIKEVISGKTWFGLFRDSWKWTDQSNFSTISWKSGQPDNANDFENCGYINNDQASDALCSDKYPFFCYRVITGQQQIMRVKVRSSQDANDPAIKVEILEQIKQKLKDRGLAESIQVTWREQPDGQVFHKKKANNTSEKEEL